MYFSYAPKCHTIAYHPSNNKTYIKFNKIHTFIQSIKMSRPLIYILNFHQIIFLCNLNRDILKSKNVIQDLRTTKSNSTTSLVNTKQSQSLFFSVH